MTALSDAELLEQARSGDQAALAELYVRHHAVARRVAAGCRRGDADDLVNEAFEKVFAAVRRQAGPTDAFRAYLFVTIRRLAARQAARNQDDPYDEVPEPVRATLDDPELDPSDRDMVAAAFSSLPERWQAVLWHTAVEGRNPREVAGALGMSGNAVAALAYRAREKLRQAYLQAHLQAAPRPACEPHRSTLGAYVRNGLGKREHATTRRHLEDCPSCRRLVGELDDVNHLLARSVLPMFMVSTIGEAVGPGNLTAGTLLGEAGISTGRRLAEALPETAGTTQAVGGVAAISVALLLAVGATGSSLLLDREAPPPPIQAVGGVTADDTPPAEADDPEPTVDGVDSTLTSMAGPLDCRDGDDEADDSPPSTEDAPDDALLPLLPVKLVLTLDAGPIDDTTAAVEPLVDLDDVVCSVVTDAGDVVLTIGADDARTPAADVPRVGPEAVIDTGVAVDLGNVAPEIEANLSLEIDDGARLELETNLDELCTHDDGNLVCTLDSALGGAVTGTLADTGLGVELDGPAGNVLTIELRDGDLVVDARLLNLLR